MINVTGGMFKTNGTTSMPKSVPSLIVDKVKLLYSSEMFLIQSILFYIKVPNKSLSQELKMFYLVVIVVVQITAN